MNLSGWQQSTLGGFLWQGLLVDGALGSRVFSAARAKISDFGKYMDASQFTSNDANNENGQGFCTVLKAMHIHYNEVDGGARLIDIQTHSVIEEQFRTLVITHLQGLVLYALFEGQETMANETNFWQILSENINSAPNPRALRRKYIESSPTFLIFFLAQTRGCDHYQTGVTLNVERLNIKFKIDAVSEAACKSCYENVLLNQQIIDPVDWTVIDTVQCMSCGRKYPIMKIEDECSTANGAECEQCGALLCRHACSRCVVFTMEHGWTHCRSCDMCHPLWKKCMTLDYLCVLCQLPLNEPRYSTVQLGCHETHIVHSLCLLQNISNGNYQCPYRCGSICRPLNPYASASVGAN